VKVYAVTAAAALGWARGAIDDETLKAASCLKPEAVFIEWLDDLTEYRELVTQCATMAAAGAVCLVTRTGNPVVANHLAKWGCVLTAKDNPPFEPKGRWLAAPDAFRRWIGRV